MARTSFSGVTLHVADLERSKAFYLRILGAELVHERPGRFVMIRIGSGPISLLTMSTRGFHIEIGTDNLEELFTQ